MQPATPSAQRRLPLEVSANVALVTVETVRAVRGVDAESVVACIEEGKIRWAWDVAAPGSASRREIRIWADEIADPAAVAGMSLASVISAVIGSTPGGRQRAAVIETRWTISAQHIAALVRAGVWQEDRIGHTRYLRRQTLEAFLQERLIQ